MVWSCESVSKYWQRRKKKADVAGELGGGHEPRCKPNYRVGIDARKEGNKFILWTLLPFI